MRHYRNLIIAGSISLVAACSNPGKSSSGDTPKTQTTAPNNDADATPIVPTPTDPTGTRILLTFKSVAGLKNITGYVVDGIDAHGFKAIDAKSGYAFFSMKPGRYDIILEAQKAGDDTSQSTSTAVGIRISGLTVKAGEDTTIKEPIDLLPTFAIKGKVHLLDGLTHGAINVQIPGTRIKTKTEADGAFTLSGVPNGTHAVTASNPGYLDAMFDSRSWSAQSTAQLEAVTLLPENQSLPTGIHYKGQGLTPNQENVVTVFLVRPTGMNRYRLSETSDFAGANWVSYQSSIDIKFPIGGERKLFVQFANASQLSAIFNVDIPVL